jgi:hypothetical protein
MTFRLTALLCALAALFAGAMPAASAAKKAKGPRVSSFSPKKPELGGTLNLKGGPFSSKKVKNTVVLRAPNGGSTFIKPKRAGKRKLVLRIPATVERLFRKSNGRSVATKFRVRVLTGRKFGPWTSKRRSPVIHPSGSTGPDGPADCDNDGLPNGADPNDDNDLLDDSLEGEIKTDICLADTDQDGIEDGWEYWAAKDLNLKAVPYPGKRPFPNALDPSDKNVDFDGDVLTSGEEHDAWVHSGKIFNPELSPAQNPSLPPSGQDRESPLYYSDGTQKSRVNPGDAGVPQWRGPQYGIPAPSYTYPQQLDTDNDGEYSDDERDADGDGLNNFIETHGPASVEWWSGVLSDEGVEPWPEAYYGDFVKERPFLSMWGDPAAHPVAGPTPGFLDGDVDGDTLLDGEDDQDNDDTINITEMYFRFLGPSAADPHPFTNAFNPCAPDQNSRTCPRYVPIGGG